MHARNTYNKKGRREGAAYAIAIETKGKTFAHHTSLSCFVSGCICIYIYFVGRAHEFIFPFVLRTQRAVPMLDDMLALGSRQLCLLVRIVAVRSARTCFAAVCRGLIALRCACGRCIDDNMLVQKKKGGATKTKIGKRGLFFEKIIKKEKGSPASNRRRRCSSGSSERPERCQWSPLRKTRQK